jgi:hypothetical protein
MRSRWNKRLTPHVSLEVPAAEPSRDDEGRATRDDDGLVTRLPCTANRATRCWTMPSLHRDGVHRDPLAIPLHRDATTNDGAHR